VTPPAGEPVIAFAEVPDFYAEVERRRATGLAGRALLVGGNPAKRGRVQSASREARADGVEPGMAMEDALARCPRAVRLPTDMPHYREAQRALALCLRRRIDAFEPVGLGGAFLDASRLPGGPDDGAASLVAAVRAELGLPLRVGIGPTRLLARLVASRIDGEGVRWIRAAETAAFVAPLPVGCLPRIGRKAEARLAELGARTIGELRSLGDAVLERELGPRARVLQELTGSGDRAPLRTGGAPMSMSREETLPLEPAAGQEALIACLERLAGALERRLVRHGLLAGRLALRVRFDDQRTVTRSVTLGEPTDDAAALQARARDLLERAGLRGRSVRRLGLTVAGLVAAGRPDPQLELFPASSR
jgi:DNA polymerase-4